MTTRRNSGGGVQGAISALVWVCLFVMVPAVAGAQPETGRRSAAQAVITVDRPVVYPDSAENRQTVEDAIVQASLHISRINLDIDLALPWARTDRAKIDQEESPLPADTERYQLSINAIREGGSNTISLVLAGVGGGATGKNASGLPLTGAWDGKLYRDIAQQVGYLRAQAQGFERSRDLEAPTFVDELYLGELVGSTITADGVNLYPYSVAVTADGDAIVGSMTLAVHVGPDFRVIDLPGLQLVEEGNYSSAMTVATTPAGSVVTRPSMGRELYLYPPGQTEPVRLRNPLTGQGGMTALPDGSIVVIDAANRRAARIEGRQVFPLDIFDSEHSYIPAIAAGPEGNIWTYDLIDRRIRVYSPEGQELDSILPMLPMEQAAGVRAMAVGSSGDVVLLSTGGLWRIDRAGRPIWAIDVLDDPAASPLGQMMGVAWHQETGTVYLADATGQRLIRLSERRVGAMRTSDGMQEFTREVISINSAIRRAGNDTTRKADLYAQKAALYEDRGALEMAQAQWQRVLTEDPFSTDAMERIDALEGELLGRQVARLDKRVRGLLADFGRETARRDYGRTIRLYEQILNLEPGNQEIQRAKTALEAEFNERNVPDRTAYPLEVANLSVEPLFPVLLQQYRSGGAGAFELRNPGDQTVEIGSATVSVGGFSDGETEIALPNRIGPGQRVAVDLPIVLNRSALELQEDLPVQVTVHITYTIDGGDVQIDDDETRGKHESNNFSVTRSATTTIHRRSALIWDNSAKLASFVTPNEEVVAGFALRVLAALEDAEYNTTEGRTNTGIANVSPRMLRAMRLSDAMGRYGINYVEDPRSPFSEVHGAEQAIDTVRFPRLTLYYRSGDCDDTSALLASLYEAAGLDTAIVTTPGHVMIAVDTQEPVSNAWMFDTSGTMAIPHDGSLWIPVETTVVNRGFATAWQEGTHLVRRHEPNGDVEFIPTRVARERYSALPLPAPSFTITEPPVHAIAEMVARSSNEVNEIVYAAGSRNLEERLSQRAGSRRIPVLNRLGILNARFGFEDRAQEYFSEVLELKNDYLPAYVNLANLALSGGDTETALAHLDRADRLRPGSPAVLELIARVNFVAGNGRAAREAVRRLAEVDPDRAGRLTAIVPPSGVAAEAATDSRRADTPRAAAAGDPAALLPPGEWLVEE